VNQLSAWSNAAFMFCSVNDSACRESLRSRARHRRHRFAGGIEEHAECLFCLIYGLFGQIAQLGPELQVSVQSMIASPWSSGGR